MKSLRITSDQLELLLEIMEATTLVDKIKNYKTNTRSLQSYAIEFNESELQQLLDKLTYSLTEVGLDNRSEANEKGLQIEKIIDQISNLLY